MKRTKVMKPKVLRGRFKRALDLTAPAWFDDDARAVWTETATLLATWGILTELDVPALAVYCALRAEVQRTPSDAPGWLALVGELRKWSHQMLLTPMARALAHFTPPPSAGGAA